jgi:hypothetical protein
VTLEERKSDETGRDYSSRMGASTQEGASSNSIGAWRKCYAWAQAYAWQTSARPSIMRGLIHNAALGGSHQGGSSIFMEWALMDRQPGREEYEHGQHGPVPECSSRHSGIRPSSGAPDSIL